MSRYQDVRLRLLNALLQSDFNGRPSDKARWTLFRGQFLYALQSHIQWASYVVFLTMMKVFLHIATIERIDMNWPWLGGRQYNSSFCNQVLVPDCSVMEDCTARTGWQRQHALAGNRTDRRPVWNPRSCDMKWTYALSISTHTCTILHTSTVYNTARKHSKTARHTTDWVATLSPWI